MTDLCNSISYPCWGYRLPILGLQAHIYAYIIYPFWGYRLFLFVWGDTGYLQFHSISILGMRGCQTILIHLWGIMDTCPLPFPSSRAVSQISGQLLPFWPVPLSWGRRCSKRTSKQRLLGCSGNFHFSPAPGLSNPGPWRIDSMHGFWRDSNISKPLWWFGWIISSALGSFKFFNFNPSLIVRSFGSSFY